VVVGVARRLEGDVAFDAGGTDATLVELQRVLD